MFIIKQFDIGTACPFVARLMLGVFQIRDKAIPNKQCEFDNLYDTFLNPAFDALRDYWKILDIDSDYRNNLNNYVFIQGNNSIEISKTIDGELKPLCNSILNNSERALKSFINNVCKFLNLECGFFLQKDCKFEKGLQNMLSADSSMAEYLKENREWASELSNLRNNMEHEGWQLPDYQYFPAQTDSGISVGVIPPQIHDFEYVEHISYLLSNFYTFAEELIMYLLSKQLEILYLYEIPLIERNNACKTRFDTMPVFFQQYPKWNLRYSGADRELLCRVSEYNM